MTKEYAQLKIGDKEFQLPILKASKGPDVIDISKLYKDSGYFTYDPAYMSTASCKSCITFIDGSEGILQYRGINVKELAQHHDYIEVVYLLLNGELPNPDQKTSFCNELNNHSMVHAQLPNLFSGFNRSAHPMAMMVAVIGSLSSFYDVDHNNEQDRELAITRLIAKMPTIAAMAYKYSIGQPFITPRNDLGFVENFLHMMFSVPAEDYRVNPVLVNALDKIFTLHADHEQNASTSTIRAAGSSGSNPFACISAGIVSLWGAAHGGANEAVINMLKNIGSVDNIEQFIARAKDKSDPFRLMGFGHRVYKNYDPRAEVLRSICSDILNELGQQDNELLKIATRLEEIALNDEYFIQRNLYPNVDFYSGIIYEAMGIPSNMFTVLFAVARSAGWISQWKEMVTDPEFKIARPRQLYIGK